MGVRNGEISSVAQWNGPWDDVRNSRVSLSWASMKGLGMLLSPHCSRCRTGTMKPYPRMGCVAIYEHAF